VNFQQQLKDDYERTRIPAPVQLGAYDRFLRRRARYGRRVLAATSATLAAALAVAVVVPRVLADRDEVADRPKDQVVSRPTLGYELVVPPGWRVAAQDAPAGLMLEPTTSTPGSVRSNGTAAPTTATTPLQPPTTAAVPPTGARSFLPRVAVTPVILNPNVYPGRPAGERPERLPEGPQLNAGPQPTTPRGPLSEAGRRTDGRAFKRHETSPLFGGPGQTYYLAWPYHCASGVRCPPALRYRALEVTGGVQPGDGRGLQAVRGALRRIVDTIRPVTNALPTGASSSRPTCQLAPYEEPVRSPASRFRRSAPDDRHPLVGAAWHAGGSVGRHAAHFSLVFAAQELTMCHLQARFTVELLRGGRLAAVQGNGAVVTLDVDLPEGDGEFPTLSKAWRWRNWCGGPNVSLRFGGLDGRGVDAKTINTMRPRCDDPGKPSTLEATSLPIHR
jgi:hypothetical protein